MFLILKALKSYEQQTSFPLNNLNYFNAQHIFEIINNKYLINITMFLCINTMCHGGGLGKCYIITQFGTLGLYV